MEIRYIPPSFMAKFVARRPEPRLVIYDAYDSRTEELLYVLHEGSYRGWRRDLLLQKLTDEIEEFLICQFCKGLLRNARLFEMDAKQELRCSVCIPELVAKQPAQLTMNQENVNNKLIICPLKVSGCEWIGPISGAVCHLDNCALFPMWCPLKCVTPEGERVRIEKRHISDHKRDSCPMREVKCDFCLVKVKACEINSHFNACEEFPISCPNGCGADLPRKKGDAHLAEDCPLQIVACVYQESGCDEMMERRNVADHERDAIHSHFKLSMVSMRKRISQLEDENSTKDLKIQKLEKVSTNLTSLIPTGKFEWKIQGFPRKILNKEDTRSGPFYVGMYKFQANISYGDDGFVCCAFYILKGEWDNSLSWPFRYEFKFIIVNQDNRDDDYIMCGQISEDFAQAEPLMFQKPIQMRNKGLKYRLISYADIIKPKYSRDHYLYLSVHIKQLLYEDN